MSQPTQAQVATSRAHLRAARSAFGAYLGARLNIDQSQQTIAETEADEAEAELLTRILTCVENLSTLMIGPTA